MVAIKDRQPAQVQRSRGIDPNLHLKKSSAFQNMAEQAGSAAEQVYKAEAVNQFTKSEAQMNKALAEIGQRIEQAPTTKMGWVQENAPGAQVDPELLMTDEDGDEAVPTWVVADEMYAQQAGQAMETISEGTLTRAAKAKFDNEFGEKVQKGTVKVAEWRFAKQQASAKAQMDKTRLDYVDAGRFDEASTVLNRELAAGLVSPAEHMTETRKIAYDQEASTYNQVIATQNYGGMQGALNTLTATDGEGNYTFESELGVGQQRKSMIQELRNNLKAASNTSKKEDLLGDNIKYLLDLRAEGTGKAIDWKRKDMQAAVDTVYGSELESFGADDPVGFTVDWLSQSPGMVPTEIQSMLRSSNRGDNENLEHASMYYQTIMDHSPRTMEDMSESEIGHVAHYAAARELGLTDLEARRSISGWQDQPEEIRRRIMDAQKEQDFTEMNQAKLAELVGEKMMGDHGRWFTSRSGEVADLRDAGDGYANMESHYEQMVKLRFKESGNHGIAAHRAFQDMQKQYNVVNINGRAEIMKNAPDGDEKQFRTNLDSLYGGGTVVQSDITTSMAISNGERPSYPVYKPLTSKTKPPKLDADNWEAEFEKFSGYEPAQAGIESMEGAQEAAQSLIDGEAFLRMPRWTPPNPNESPDAVRAAEKAAKKQEQELQNARQEQDIEKEMREKSHSNAAMIGFSDKQFQQAAKTERQFDDLKTNTSNFLKGIRDKAKSGGFEGTGAGSSVRKLSNAQKNAGAPSF